MKKPNRNNIKEAVRFTLEKYDIRDVTPSAVRHVLGSLGYEILRLGDDAGNEKLTALGHTPSELQNDLLVVRRDKSKCVFIAADAEDARMLPLLSRALGFIVLCDTENGVYGANADDRAAADEFSRTLAGITGRGTLGNLIFFHPSAVLGIAVLIAAAVFAGFVLFGDRTVELPGTADTGERTLPPVSQPADPVTVPQEPLRVGEQTDAPARLDELAGGTASPVSDGFIPLPPDTPLPGYDASVSAAGAPQTAAVTDRTVPSSASAAVTPSAAAPVSATPSGYYATGSGKKYHTADCSYLNGKTPVSVSAEDIASGKYTPCSKCIK